MNRLSNRVLGTFLLVAVAFLGAASPSRGTAPSSYTVADLGFGIVTGINDAGHAVYINGGHSYLWVNGTATDLGAFSALAINGSDVVVGNQGSNAVEWTSGGGLVTLPLLAGFDGASATAINASGVVTGYAYPSWSPGTSHAVVWSSALSSPTDLDGAITNTCQSSEGHGINSSGMVAAEGGYPSNAGCFPPLRAAFTLGSGTATQLTTSTNHPSVAKAINDSGVVVGSIRVAGNDDAFLWDGTLHDLGPQVGTNSSAYAINNAGDVVGFTGNLPATGWVYEKDTGTVTNLLVLTGIQLIPMGINSSGQIAARSTVTQHSYVLTPVYPDADLAASLSHSPEPATIDPGTDKAHVVWTARLTNNGPGGANGAQLSVALPSGFSLSAGGLDSHCTGTGPFTCTPTGGTLASGAHVDFSIAADASTTVSANATATASATSNDPTSSNDTATDATTVGAPVPTFAPASGRAGAPVTIHGAAFTGATAVDFHGTPASFTIASDTEIDATVTAGATSGTIAVVTPSGTWTSTQSFTVIPPAPTITAFSPAQARPGVGVTVTGTNLATTSSVRLGGAVAAFTVASDAQLTFTVPPAATSGHISVTTLGGATSSADVLRVPLAPPNLQGISPLKGQVGVTVTITGQNFSGTTGVAFNGTSAAFVVVSDTRVTAQVPPGATTGPISITTPAGKAKSWSPFTVLPPAPPVPTITDFSPMSGPRGMRVTIHGSGFLNATAVRFGGVQASFRVVGSSTISAVVPRLATTGHITVTTPGGTATSAQSFVI